MGRFRFRKIFHWSRKTTASGSTADFQGPEPRKAEEIPAATTTDTASQAESQPANGGTVDSAIPNGPASSSVVAIEPDALEQDALDQDALDPDALDAETLRTLDALQADTKLPTEVRSFISCYVRAKSADPGKEPVVDPAEMLSTFHLKGTDRKRDSCILDLSVGANTTYTEVAARSLVTSTKPPLGRFIAPRQITTPRSQYKVCSWMQKGPIGSLPASMITWPSFGPDDDLTNGTASPDDMHTLAFSNEFRVPQNVHSADYRGSMVSNSSISEVSVAALYVPSVPSSVVTDNTSVSSGEMSMASSSVSRYLDDFLVDEPPQPRKRSHLRRSSRRRESIMQPRLDLSNPNRYSGCQSMAGPYPVFCSSRFPQGEPQSRQKRNSLTIPFAI